MVETSYFTVVLFCCCATETQISQTAQLWLVNSISVVESRTKKMTQTFRPRLS